MRTDVSTISTDELVRTALEEATTPADRLAAVNGLVGRELTCEQRDRVVLVWVCYELEEARGLLEAEDRLIYHCTLFGLGNNTSRHAIDPVSDVAGPDV